jgi:hypothetical protein
MRANMPGSTTGCSGWGGQDSENAGKDPRPHDDRWIEGRLSHHPVPYCPAQMARGHLAFGYLFQNASKLMFGETSDYAT